MSVPVRKAKKSLVEPLTKKPICRKCGEGYAPARRALGYLTCLDCGSPVNTYTAIVFHKQGNIVLSTDRTIAKEQVKQTNQKSR